MSAVSNHQSIPCINTFGNSDLCAYIFSFLDHDSLIFGVRRCNRSFEKISHLNPVWKSHMTAIPQRFFQLPAVSLEERFNAYLLELQNKKAKMKFLRDNSDVSTYELRGFPPLYWSIKLFSPELMANLENKPLDEQIKLVSDYLNNRHLISRLIIEKKYDSDTEIKILSIILKLGANPNVNFFHQVSYTTHQRTTPLHVVVRLALTDPSKIKLAHLFLDHGANLSALNEANQTPLQELTALHDQLYHQWTHSWITTKSQLQRLKETYDTLSALLVKKDPSNEKCKKPSPLTK